MSPFLNKETRKLDEEQNSYIISKYLLHKMLMNLQVRKELYSGKDWQTVS
jgi:hypothetical protein